MGRPRINIGSCNRGCGKPAWTKKLCRRCYSADRYRSDYVAQKEARRNSNRRHLERIKEHKRQREHIDIDYRLANRLRSRLNKALKGETKLGSAYTDLGCSVDELKRHLQSLFEDGMTWDNWTTNGWHIDHIKPLVSFDLTDPDQVKKACHYTNLQPLWAEDNLKKGASYGT